MPSWFARKLSASDATSPSRGYCEAAINEIRMLLDFISGSSSQTLRTLTIPDPSAHPASGDAPLLKTAEILNRLNALEQKIGLGGTVTSDERTFLQLLRDALSVLVRPASSLTIAYSAMVVRRQRQWGRTRAEQAFGSYVGLATWHRWGQRLLMVLALLFAVVAVSESARVALGRSILQTIQSLQQQRAAINAEIKSIEQVDTRSGDQGPSAVAFTLAFGNDRPVIRLCDRPGVIAYQAHKGGTALPMIDNETELALFDSPEERDVCDRDRILAADFVVAHDALEQFHKDWTAFLGQGVAISSRMLQGAICWAAGRLSVSCESPSLSRSTKSDLDLSVAPVILVLGNYVLPIIFATLGASVYVILDFYAKVRDSLLLPRDYVLSWIRLVLGVVLGACVGLFFTSSTPAATTGAGLADSITLSASGLAFLAGFGVEGVFGLLDSLVRRVFTGNQDKGGQIAPSA
jgi:hypothetical protein